MILSNTPTRVEVVEVAPRDGFQSISTPLPTADKIIAIQALIDAGIKRIEIGSFVSPKAIPQMADIADIVRAFIHMPEVHFSALVPNTRGAELALNSGIRELVYVISVSETHNQKNVRQTVAESLNGLSAIADRLRQTDQTILRLDLGTCFDCPYEGRISWQQVDAVLDQALVLTHGIELEIALCDTTGRAAPHQVAEHFSQLRTKPGRDQLKWAFHGHDTFGMGVANALFAIHSGATAVDASAAGLGGCPFAPGATGNTATEDIVYALQGADIDTGVDLLKLLQAADIIAALPGGLTASHLRTVPRARVA